MAQSKLLQGAAALVGEQLPQGAFLCVGGETRNVMTIGWGGLAFYWNRDVFVVPVRRQRFTYPLLEKTGTFAVCVPAVGTMAEALMQAGTLTGRDGDKFDRIGLAIQPAKEIDVPIVKGCALVLECRILAKNAFTGEKTDPAIIAYTYEKGDFHTLYYGEVVACYTGDAV